MVGHYLYRVETVEVCIQYQERNITIMINTLRNSGHVRTRIKVVFNFSFNKYYKIEIKEGEKFD